MGIINLDSGSLENRTIPMQILFFFYVWSHYVGVRSALTTRCPVVQPFRFILCFHHDSTQMFQHSQFICRWGRLLSTQQVFSLTFVIVWSVFTNQNQMPPTTFNASTTAFPVKNSCFPSIPFPIERFVALRNAINSKKYVSEGSLRTLSST